jgi:anti-sigma B factor antagonist
MAAPLALIEDGPAADGRVVALRGEIDVGSTPALREWLGRASEGGRQSLIVDLRNVDFMAVSGLYVLCDEQSRMARHQARLTVVCDNARMLQLFEVCRLTDVLRIVRTRAALNGDGWGVDDEDRAERLRAWLERYSAGGGGSAVSAEPAPSTPPSAPPPPAAS